MWGTLAATNSIRAVNPESPSNRRFNISSIVAVVLEDQEYA